MNKGTVLIVILLTMWTIINAKPQGPCGQDFARCESDTKIVFCKNGYFTYEYCRLRCIRTDGWRDYCDRPARPDVRGNKGNIGNKGVIGNQRNSGNKGVNDNREISGNKGVPNTRVNSVNKGAISVNKGVSADTWNSGNKGNTGSRPIVMKGY